MDSRTGIRRARFNALALLVLGSGCYASLGLLGLTMAITLVHRELGLGIRTHRITHHRLEAVTLRQVWLSQHLVAVRCADGVVWIFSDELSAAEWSRLRRWLLVHIPRAPLGLSTSR